MYLKIMAYSNYKILILSLLIIGFFPTYGQEINIDSLKQELRYTHDSNRIPTLLKIAEYYDYKDLPLAIKFANEALQVAKENQDETQLFICRKTLAAYYFDIGKYKKAKILFSNALQTATDHNYFDRQCEMLLDIGYIYHRKGILDSANLFFNHSYELSQKEKDTIWIISSLRAIGDVHFNKGQFDESLNYYFEALKLVKQKKCCIAEKSKLFNNLGVLFSDKKEYAKSLHYYNAALSIMDSLNDVKEISRIYNNLGTIYWYKNKPDSALIYYTKSLKIREKSGDLKGLAFVLNNLGMLSGDQHDYKQSLYYFKQSLQYHEKLSNRYGTVMALYNIGYVYQDMGQYKSAKKYYSQSYRIAQAQGFTDYITANLEALKTIYASTKNWEKAYFTLQKYNTTIDSLSEAHNMKLLNTMETTFNKEKQQAKQNILQNHMEASRLEKNKSRRLVFGVLIILLLVVGLSYLLLRQIRIRNHIKENKLTPTLLRYQLNPQFINSSLFCIKDLIIHKRIKDASISIAGFSKIIRVFVETSTSNGIMLDKEIKTVKNFFMLHQLHDPNKLKFQIDLVDVSEPELIAVPPFLVFPVFIHIIDYHRTTTITIKGTITNEVNYLNKNIEISYFTENSEERTNNMNNIAPIISHIQERIRVLNRPLKENMKFHYKHRIKKDNSNIINMQLQIPINPKY